MEKKSRKMLVISLTLSLITAVLIYIYISGIKPEQTPETEYIKIYAAARTIPEHTKIAASDIKEVEEAKEQNSAKIVTDKHQAIRNRA